MTSERKAAFVAGASLGVLLIFVDSFVLRMVGAGAAGVLLIRLWTPASGKAIPHTEGVRMGIITGLIVGITRQLLLLLLVIAGVFFDPAPALMEPPADATLRAFEQEWGINYYTFNVLLDVFGGAALAGLGAMLGVRLYETPPDR